MAENTPETTPGSTPGHDRTAIAAWIPQLRLRLTTPRLEFRVPDESDLRALAELVAEQGIHDRGTVPFQGGWSDAPQEVVAGRVLQYLWKGLALSRPDYWNLGLAAFLDGQAIGVQGLQARRFPQLREVASESWLARGYQGRGLGTEMRAAALRLAFEGLGAAHATSAVYEDGAAAIAVNKKYGYQPDGIEVTERQGKPTVLTRWRLTRDQWELSAAAEVPTDVHGLEFCRGLFGITAPDHSSAPREPA